MGTKWVKVDMMWVEMDKINLHSLECSFVSLADKNRL